MSNTIKSLLLVDDDTDDQLLFCEAAKETDETVHCFFAVNGLDALDKLRSGCNPDIIIMDMNMPKMNGLECLKELKNSTDLQNIPVIIYSTSFCENIKKECLQNGAVACMEKPTDYLLICSQIENIINFGMPANHKMSVSL